MTLEKDAYDLYIALTNYPPTDATAVDKIKRTNNGYKISYRGSACDGSNRVVQVSFWYNNKDDALNVLSIVPFMGRNTGNKTALGQKYKEKG